jgi:hypothetical protein
MINKGLSAILLSILIVCFFSFTEVSADVNKPVISLNNASVIQGNSVTLTLSISTTIPYSALEIYILYDTTHFKADSVTHLSLFNNVNHQKDALIDSDHQVKYIFVSTSNVTLSGNLLNIRFTTLNDANIDTFVVNVAINGMYDENSNSIEANTSNGSITITEKIVPIKSVSFNRSINKTQLQIEDLIVFTISSSNLQSMAASNFEMIFDHNHFEFIKVDYGSALKTLDVLIDINTNTRGLVLIAFAKIDGLSQANPLMTFTFKVKADIDISGSLTFQSKNTIDINFLPIQTNIVTQNYSISKKPVEIILPEIQLTSYLGTINDDFYIDVILDKEANLSAGDFQIVFDHNILSYDGYLILTEKPVIIADDEEETDEKEYIKPFFIVNYRLNEKKLTFSVIDTDGITEESLLRIYFTSKSTVPVVTDVTISGNGLVDQNLNSVSITYKKAVIELRNGYNVTFKDYDGSLISSNFILLNTNPVMPVVIPRENTTFIGWSEEVKPFTSDLTYVATYSLNMSGLTIENKKTMYSGLTQTIDVLGMPDGARIEFSMNSVKDVGIYDIEVSIFLDDKLQDKVIKKLEIEPKPIEITLGTFEMTLYSKFPDITFTHNGLYEGDDLELTFITTTNTVGTHELDAVSNNENYIVKVNKGTLTVLDFPFDFGDINQDQKISIIDAALMQLHLANLITLTEGQLALSDVNRDSKVDIKDIAMLQLIIAGLIQLESPQPSALKFQKLNAFVSPSLQTVQLSNLTFKDQTFIYDNTYKTIEVIGELPLGVKSITYANHLRKDVGTQYVFARFEVEEGYFKPNDMVSKLTILKATLDAIPNRLNVIYDPLKTFNALNDFITPYEDIITPSYESFSYHLPGVYEIKATYESLNYETKDIIHTLTIEKRPMIISNSEILYIKTSHSITFNERPYMKVAFENGPFEDTLDFTDLKPFHTYKIYVYIEESQLDQMSPMIELHIQTYDSIIETLLTLEHKKISLHDLNTLLELHERLKHIDQDTFVESSLTLDRYISIYNRLVDDIISEYQTAEEMIPIRLHMMTGLGLWTWLLLKRRF